MARADRAVGVDIVDLTTPVGAKLVTLVLEGSGTGIQHPRRAPWTGVTKFHMPEVCAGRTTLVGSRAVTQGRQSCYVSLPDPAYCLIVNNHGLHAIIVVSTIVGGNDGVILK